MTIGEPSPVSWMQSMFDTPSVSRNGHEPAGVADVYDAVMASPVIQEYYEHSDFCNWGYWLDHTTSQRDACENLVEILLSMVPVKRGSALDVACGTGATTRHLLRYYDPSAVTAINLSARQLSRAREVAPGCRFAVMDATDLEFPDATFDLVLCVEAAFHFDTRRAFLEETLRVLRPGGRLLLSDILFRRQAHARDHAVGAANYVRDADDYHELLEDTGFTGVDVIDATEACWDGYERHHAGWAVGRKVAGDLDDRTFELLRRRHEYLMSVTTAYLLAGGQRP